MSVNDVKKPLVSVIIPCYNHQNYIESCFLSIMKQTYLAIELVIIDDCSKDASVNIIKKNLERLQQRFERVEIREHKINKGLTKTLNEGLKLSRGAYIKVLASDDMIHPKCIEILVDTMEQKKEYDMLFSNGQYISETCSYEDAIKLNNREFYMSNPLLDNKDIVKTLYLGNFIVGGTVFFRRSTYERLGNYDEDIPIEDWEYNLRVAINGVIGFIGEPIFFYRQVKTSMSHINKTGAYIQRYETMYQGTKAVIEKYRQYVGEEIYLKKMINLYEAYVDKAFSVRWIKKMKELKQNMQAVNAWNYRWQIKYFISLIGVYSLFSCFRDKIKKSVN